MTLVRYKNRANSEVAFNNLLSDLFPQSPSIYRDDLKQAVPVNIRETEKEYVLEVIAPGFAKEDFQVSLDKNILTVSAEKKTENANENEKLVRREYKFGSFKRSFTIDEKIAADGIAAQYVNGVLLLTLPKREDVKPATKQINIQ